MAAFEINKGVGRTVEFKGLKAQYLFLFAGGLLAVFILVVILYLCGVSQITCLVIGVMGASLVVWQTFTMNRKYGQYDDPGIEVSAALHRAGLYGEQGR